MRPRVLIFPNHPRGFQCRLRGFAFSSWGSRESISVRSGATKTLRCYQLQGARLYFLCVVLECVFMCRCCVQLVTLAGVIGSLQLHQMKLCDPEFLKKPGRHTHKHTASNILYHMHNMRYASPVEWKLHEMAKGESGDHTPAGRSRGEHEAELLHPDTLRPSTVCPPSTPPQLLPLNNVAQPSNLFEEFPLASGIGKAVIQALNNIEPYRESGVLAEQTAVPLVLVSSPCFSCCAARVFPARLVSGLCRVLSWISNKIAVCRSRNLLK